MNSSQLYQSKFCLILFLNKSVPTITGLLKADITVVCRALHCLACHSEKRGHACHKRGIGIWAVGRVTCFGWHTARLPGDSWAGCEWICPPPAPCKRTPPRLCDLPEDPFLSMAPVKAIRCLLCLKVGLLISCSQANCSS